MRKIKVLIFVFSFFLFIGIFNNNFVFAGNCKCNWNDFEGECMSQTECYNDPDKDPCDNFTELSPGACSGVAITCCIPKAVDTCASQGGKCVELNQCNAATIGKFDCTGTKECCHEDDLSNCPIEHTNFECQLGTCDPLWVPVSAYTCSSGLVCCKELTAADCPSPYSCVKNDFCIVKAPVPDPDAACSDAIVPNSVCCEDWRVPKWGYDGPIINNIPDLIAPIVKILYYAGIIIGVAAIIYAGYVYMTSQGNPQQVQEASNWLTSAVVGILFILLSVAIFRVIIVSLLGLDVGF